LKVAFEENEYHLAAKLDCEIVIHNEQQLSQLLALEQTLAVYGVVKN